MLTSVRLVCVVGLALLPAAMAGLVPDFLGVGYCKDLPLQPDFDPVKFQGYWFDVKRVPNEYTEVADCISSIAVYSEPENALNITNTGLDANGDYTEGKGTSMIPNVETGPRMPANMKLLTDPYPPYMIVSTDYTSYACIYSCMQFSMFNAEFMWIYSRTPEMSKDRESYCMWLFHEADIDTSAVITIQHGEACPYYSKLDMMLKHNEKLFKEWGMDPTQSSDESFNTMIVSTNTVSTNTVATNSSTNSAGSAGSSYVCDTEPNLCPWLNQKHNGASSTEFSFLSLMATIIFARFVRI